MGRVVYADSLDRRIKKKDISQETIKICNFSQRRLKIHIIIIRGLRLKNTQMRMLGLTEMLVCGSRPSFRWGREKKGPVYGIGSSDIHRVVTGTFSTGSPSFSDYAQSQQEVQMLREKLQTMEEQMKTREEKFEERQTEMERKQKEMHDMMATFMQSRLNSS